MERLPLETGLPTLAIHSHHLYRIRYRSRNTILDDPIPHHQLPLIGLNTKDLDTVPGLSSASVIEDEHVSREIYGRQTGFLARHFVPKPPPCLLVANDSLHRFGEPGIIAVVDLVLASDHRRRGRASPAG
jgi:hypothetical protein